MKLKKLVLVLVCSFVYSICLSKTTDFFKEKKIYQLSSELIDVVCVCHPKDARTLELVIAGIRENGKNIRRIIVVSSQQLTDEAEWFNENAYPFNKYDIALEIFDGNKKRAEKYLASPNSRIGWVYQQLLKLYAPFVIPGISSNVLIVDADTIFLNPTEFIDNDGHALFNPGSEYHRPYFEHGERLLPGFKKVYPNYSGIAHHMLFQRSILEDLLMTIERVHGVAPWRALCKCIRRKELPGSSMSEYELYFNFAFAKTNQVKIRKLLWKNILFNEHDMYAWQKNGYHYVSCHSWIG